MTKPTPKIKIKSNDTMTSEELENALSILKWDDTKASIKLGISSRSVYRYRIGEQVIPKSIALLINLYLQLFSICNATQNSSKRWFD